MLVALFGLSALSRFGLLFSQRDQLGGKIVPLEVKAERNLQAKSLKVYRDKFQPEVSIRTSMSDYKMEDWLLNLPLWAVGEKLNAHCYWLLRREGL